MENFVSDKLDCMISHGGVNGITNVINFQNSLKKVVENVKKNSSNTKLNFLVYDILRK